MFKISEDMLGLNVGGFTLSETEEVEKAEEALMQIAGEDKMTLEDKDRLNDLMLTVKTGCAANGFLRGFSIGYELAKEINELKK